MLPQSHYRAYQGFMTLLTKFNCVLVDCQKDLVFSEIEPSFDDLQKVFTQNIVSLDSQSINPQVVSRWQSLQTEIKREFKLLSTGILFLASARQSQTKLQKLQSVKDHTTKLINYCQIMLNKDEE